MSNIKERDILKLLDGRASAKKLKKLEKWTSSKKKNASDLEKYQRIFDEVQSLAGYRKVNSKKEWKSFVKMMDQTVTDQQLLSYFDGVASSDEKKQIESWKSISVQNEKDFKTYDLILNESASLKDHKTVDLDAEWAEIQKSLDEKAKARLTAIRAEPTSTVAHTGESSSTKGKEVAFVPAAAPSYSEEKSNSRWMWRTVAIAATLLLLAAFWFMLRPGSGFGFSSGSDQDLYATFTTEDSPDIITLSDGSVLSLNEYTSITYFTDVNKIESREVSIEGTGEFDVRSDPMKPFVVKAPLTGVGVRVLGTRFRLEKHEEYVEVIENLEGSVRAYSLADTSINVTLEKGDKYGFDGTKFVNLRDLQQEYEGIEYEILYILDYIMEESDWRVTSAPYSEFDAESVVEINLEQPYEDILRDLKTQADFDYIPLDCDGCFKITRFLAK